MTPGQIIAHRRRRLLELADQLGNISEACRQIGVSRQRYYEWKNLADQYGLDALTPKERRRPQLPNATPTHVVTELLTVAVTELTLGCRQLADRLAERSYVVSKTTVFIHGELWSRFPYVPAGPRHRLGDRRTP